MDKKIIYLDHAATTYTDPEVVRAIEPYFTEKFYNPSSLYTPARDVAHAVKHARSTIAKWIRANNDREIIFTASGSEGDNAAIFGIANANRDKGRHIITSAVEHPAVLETVEGMKRFGFDHTILPVDKFGMVDPNTVRDAIRDDTVLITIMLANNEVGTIQPIKEIGRIARERGVYFHTDAVQAVGSVPIDVHEMNLDALTMAAHKLYGPKGVGALYLRDGVAFDSLIKGGHQENGKRAGTHNNPGIVGLAKAVDLAYSNMQENNERIIRLREKLINNILENIPDVILNGHPTKRLPNNTNFCFKYIDSEAILLHLDMLGVCASSGSACSSGTGDPSVVLKAMGIPPEVARGSLRMTLGKDTTDDEIDFVIKNLIGIVGKLRDMSPLVD
ncbi:MAG: cysteine desulfurase NifS [Candidatus Eremiobacteraeota bacterium]|nr:cysteine desulfurase NifS [Candidatus Eremiobacteraeota bacterium]